MVGDVARMDLPGLVDLREDVKAPIEVDREHNERMRKKVGNGMKLSDGFMLYWIGGDFFLMSNTGDIKLLLCWDLITEGRRKWVEPIRFIHVDKGIGERLL